jgi:hypothetical protein
MAVPYFGMKEYALHFDRIVHGNPKTSRSQTLENTPF